MKVSLVIASDVRQDSRSDGGQDVILARVE